MTNRTSDIKHEARKIVDGLSDSVTWDNVLYAFFVRRSIERGLNDADSGKLTDLETIRKKFESTCASRK